MMKKLRFGLLALLLWTVAASGFAIAVPANVSAALKKMYPDANGVAWTRDGNYYVAAFVVGGFNEKAWFTPQAQWAMSQTDWQSLDRVSPGVYNAFVSGPYSSWVVEDVTLVEFPRWQSIIVVEVGQDNLATKYQLFYTPRGRLLRVRNVTYLYGTLGASTFL